MIHNIIIEIETEGHITSSQVIDAIEQQFFTDGELFDIDGTDGIICSIEDLKKET